MAKERLEELQREAGEIMKTELPKHMREGEGVRVIISICQLHGRDRVEFPLAIDIAQFGDGEHVRQAEPSLTFSGKGK